MSKKAYLGVMVVALAVVMAAGALYASNMGFKLNYSLSASDGGTTSKTGTNTLALPDNRQAGINDAFALMGDIGFASVQNVQKFITSSDGLTTYTGRKGSAANFNLGAGEGYFVKMGTGVNYIVVGSDNPTLAYQLNSGPIAGTSKTGTSFFAYNYHQTAVKAYDLMLDIGFASVQNVQKFLKNTDGLTTYTGRKGSAANFDLAPGEAYFVKMGTTVSYIPSHY